MFKQNMLQLDHIFLDDAKQLESRHLLRYAQTKSY